jgi:rare lipoprotein A (peptidoglycan hydrolase)
VSFIFARASKLPTKICAFLGAKQFPHLSVVREITLTDENKMKSMLLPTALLFALQAATSTPSAAAKSKMRAAHLHSRTHDSSYKIDRHSRHRNSSQTGMASYYSRPQRLSSSGRFNPRAMTAAHRTLPFGTRVRVTHTGTGRSVDVRINDRGPFTAGRIIDLSEAAARVIGLSAQGVARVTIGVLGH